MKSLKKTGRTVDGLGGGVSPKQLSQCFPMRSAVSVAEINTPPSFPMSKQKEKTTRMRDWTAKRRGEGESLSQVQDGSRPVMSRMLTVEMTLSLFKQGHSASMLHTAHWAVKS